MQIKQLKKDELKHEYAVTFTAEEIGQRVDAKLQEIGKTIKMPGFRPGKVPLKVLKSKYGQAVLGEVLEGAVNESSRRAINENELRPAMQPKIEVKSFDENQGLEYTMEIELLPEFEVADLSSIKLEKLHSKPSDDNVQETIKRIADQYKETKKVETKRAAKKGDTVVIDFDGTVDGTPFPGMKGSDFYLQLGSGSFVDTFEDQLVGAKAGDKRTVTVTFPQDYGQPKLQGVEAVFEVEVKELREGAETKIDAEFSKKLGFESVEKLEAAVRDQMQKEYDQVARMNLKRQLLDAMDAKHTFSVPQGMVDAEFFAIWQQLKGHQHPDDPRHEHGEHCNHGADDKGTKEENKEYRDLALRRVKLGLILAEIGKVNKVEISNQEIQQAVVAEARKYPGQEAQVFAYFQKNPQAVETIKAPLYEEKVVDFVLEQVKLTEKEVSIDDLTKAANEE